MSNCPQFVDDTHQSLSTKHEPNPEDKLDQRHNLESKQVINIGKVGLLQTIHNDGIKRP